MQASQTLSVFDQTVIIAHYLGEVSVAKSVLQII